MKIYHGYQSFNASDVPIALTIGNFDGVHLGHKQVLKYLIEQAKEIGGESLVYTFDPHPMQVLRPELDIQMLFDREDQIEQFHSLGVDHLVLEKFDLNFSKISSEEFLEKIVRQKLSPKSIVVGYDFNFGSGKSGTAEMIMLMAQKCHIRCEVIPPFKIENSIVSSSQIRKSINAGDVELANHYLGRNFYFRGKVVEGEKRGKKMGFPTANVIPTVNIKPQKGVYFSKSTLHGITYSSITNIGNNPTFESGRELHFETFILDFDKMIYGEQLKVELIHYHRNEIKFSGVEALIRQINLDVSEAKKYFYENI